MFSAAIPLEPPPMGLSGSCLVLCSLLSVHVLSEGEATIRVLHPDFDESAGPIPCLLHKLGRFQRRIHFRLMIFSLLTQFRVPMPEEVVALRCTATSQHGDLHK